MSAWLEVDSAPYDVAMVPRVWDRVTLDEARPLLLSGDHTALALGFVRSGDVLLDVTRGGDRWVLRPRVKDIYRNGVVLVSGERYSLENGDRLEVMRGVWLRFLDDATPLPLPRLRQLGSHTFLFAPSPPDGSERWRALVRGSDELLVALRGTSLLASEDRLAAAFPAFVRIVHTPAGPFALLRDAAGVTLADILARTAREGAELDEALAEAIARAVAAARDHAAVAGFRAPPLQEDVLITWEGAVCWLGVRGHVEGSMLRRGQRDPFAREDPLAEPARGDEVTRALAGVLAALFPDERAAEMALREEVLLWTRDGLSNLERATRGRPSP